MAPRAIDNLPLFYFSLLLYFFHMILIPVMVSYATSRRSTTRTFPGAHTSQGKPARWVRAHVRQERVGGDVQHLLLLHPRVVPAPAVAHDVQHNEMVREIGAEVSPDGSGR